MGLAPRILRKLRCVLIALVVLIALAAVPIARNEASCMNLRTEAAPFRSALDAAYRRDEVNTYLTYPEWSIVHAYEDFAGVTRRGSESDFAYFASVGSYWSSLCGITQLASSRGPISLEYKVMLYTIGLSFAAEMGVKGIYEESIGRITSWIRGPRRTPEDEFALALADDYAAFLRQTPWYEYPFASKLVQFWTTTPVTLRNPIRSLERRIGLSLEYGVKAIYARLIGLGAAAAPAPLRIRSVVKGFDASDLSVGPGITLIDTLENGANVIETPRYRAFTDILRKLAARGRDVAEIAGNDDILVTVLAREGAGTNLPDAKQLFAVPVQSRPGWRRLGLDVKVPALLGLIRGLHATNFELEHVYDY
jgi:hypothetical protein